jgi:hypothetical protein
MLTGAHNTLTGAANMLTGARNSLTGAFNMLTGAGQLIKLVRHEFHRSGKEVRQQQWSLAK